MKKQLEERWRSIHEKLQAQAAPESEDAAGIRKYERRTLKHSSQTQVAAPQQASRRKWNQFQTGVHAEGLQEGLA